MNASMAVPNWLATAGTLEPAPALQFLRDQGNATPAALSVLADAALAQVETDLGRAQHWLAIGQALQTHVSAGSLVAEPKPTPSSEANIPAAIATAQLAYAQARIAAHQGQLTEAENALRSAQAIWQGANEQAWAARSLLGLTQILAMQGRYTEAEATARNAIALLTTLDSAPDSAPDSTPDFARLLQLAGAHHNLATLFVYTERHRAALTAYEQAATVLNSIDHTRLDEADVEQLTLELAHNALNRASALTFLDQPEAAEQALRQASEDFTRIGDFPDRGRAQTNLGRLYLRTGRYAAALRAFDRATADLIGEATSETTLTLDQLRQADELLLEQAMAYLVMNLLPEAEQALARSEALFRSADQPYELAQTLYTWGILRLRATEWASAQPLLAEAAARFATLQNHFWLNRTRLAQAALAYRQGDLQEAGTHLETLWVTAGVTATNEQNRTDTSPTVQTDAKEPAGQLTWDIAGLAELHLLRLRLAVEQRDVVGADATANTLASLLGLDLTEIHSAVATSHDTPEETARLTGPLPHYALRFHHLLGQLAQTTGNFAVAQIHYQHALAILEEQRATLPVEEIRTAFLDDKAEIYVDLVQLLLERADEDPTLVAAAFATVERARSRALLERLLTATSGDATHQTTAPHTATAEGVAPGQPANAPDVAGDAGTTAATDPVEALRQRLHWLYNQLLGESGSRNLNSRLSEQLLQEEAALQRLEWRRSTLLHQAEPVDLQTFQAALADDQQAIVYTILGREAAQGTEAPDPSTETTNRTSPLPGEPSTSPPGAEVVAFLIDRNSIRVFRRLTDTVALQQALDELRFQLGRAELGKAYVERHQERLRVRLHEVLARLYQLLLAPLRPLLAATRLLIVPAGPLHRLPFHALWDGETYLLANYECSYAPSASVVVMRRRQTPQAEAITSWAGLAVNDEAIPAARMEVTGVASYFPNAHLYLDEAAGRQGLERAAQANILHLATHGLFRPDNPFFSALKLADGWIDVREIYRLPLQARLVILSACESGAGQIRGGDEVVGLARGFLGAGASEVVASLWNVHDESAVQLMDHFYRHLVSEVQNRPAAALRAAQLAAIAAQQHPYYWAPFFVIGE
ncbi:MAG: CHAT domain-containing protein [Caldilineaceae bacterium]|nr:CHAT domain-containing protein [Caldilineaceae bacterium]